MLLETSTDSGFLDGFLGALEKFFYVVPEFIYFVCSCMFQIIDLCQLLFRKLVGLDTYYIAGSDGAQHGDIIFSIMKNTFLGEGAYKPMNTAFWSITLLGLILLFVTTIAGLLRNEYSPDKEKLNSKSGVMKNAFKALISLVIIPITCFFCLYLGNSIIIAVDAATQPSNDISLYINPEDSEDADGFEMYVIDGDETPAAYIMFGLSDAPIPTTFTPMSGIIFRAACYNANRVRLNNDFYTQVIALESQEGSTTNFGAFNKAEGPEHCASMIDEAFELGIAIKTPKPLNMNPELFDDPTWCGTSFVGNNNAHKNINRFNLKMVSYYYNLWQFDFIVAFAFAIMIGKLFLEITLGLMQRLIEIMALLFFLPIVASFMPVDDSAGFKKWRAHFITKTLSAYVTIISINIFFIIYPLLRSIKFFPDGMVYDALNNILSAIFMLAGMLSIKTINSMFATMFTIDKISANVMDQGASAMSGVRDLAVKGATATMALAKIPLAPVAGAVKHGFAAGKTFVGNHLQERRERQRENAVTRGGQNSVETKMRDSGITNQAQIDAERNAYADYRSAGSAEAYANQQIAQEVTNDAAYRGASQSVIDAEIQRRQQAFAANPSSNAALRDRMERFREADKAADKAGSRFDQKHENRKNTVKGMGGAVAQGVSTPLSFLKDLVGWGGGKK